MLSGCIMCSTSACGMFSCSWLNVVLSSPLRPFDVGARNSAGASPTTFAAAGHSLETSGTGTVCHEHISEVGDVELYERLGRAPRRRQSGAGVKPSQAAVAKGDGGGVVTIRQLVAACSRRVAILAPSGLPRPVQASQRAPAAKFPLLPLVMSFRLEGEAYPAAGA
jgi:hypothetical protein